jgi:hypothetical protein
MEPPSETAPGFLHVFGTPGARGLRTERGFRRGEVVCPIPATARHRRPERTTVQLDESTHAEVGILTTMNHSCDPSVRLDTTRMLVVAERDIAPGEELTYFYPSTEWDMAEPFECRCGNRSCLGTVRGAGHVQDEILRRYFLNAHILRMKGQRAEVPWPGRR